MLSNRRSFQSNHRPTKLSFYRATLCWAEQFRLSVRLYVCPSVTRVLCINWKRLNVSSKFFNYLIGPSF